MYIICIRTYDVLPILNIYVGNFSYVYIYTIYIHRRFIKKNMTIEEINFQSDFFFSLEISISCRLKNYEG